MSRVLVLGSGGMAGHVIAYFLHERGHEVLGLQRQIVPAPFELVSGDVLDFQLLASVISESRPATIVNAVGVLNTVANEDPARTIRTNAYLPRHLEAMSRNLGIQFLHISTDCVFSGTRGHYTESDIPDAVDLYGLTKAAGEVVQSSVTFRTSIVGPELRLDGQGLFNWFMSQKGPIRGYTKVMWGGITTVELAKAIDWAITTRPDPGLIHLSNGMAISKFDLLSLLAREFSRETVIHESATPRSDKSLQASVRCDVPKIPNYPAMIHEMASWISTHDSLYGTQETAP